MSFNKDEYIKQMKLREKLNELTKKEADIEWKCNSSYDNKDIMNEIQRNQMLFLVHNNLYQLHTNI